MHSTELFPCAYNSTHTLKYVATENFSQTFIISNLRQTVRNYICFPKKETRGFIELKIIEKYHRVVTSSVAMSQ